MGTDKAWLDWQGMPLIRHTEAWVRVQQAIQPATVWVSCSPSNIAIAKRHFDHTLLDHPEYSGRGPLAGMHAGLLATQKAWLWVLPCDGIRFANNLLVRMLQLALSEPQAEAVVVGTRDGEGPLRLHPVWALISQKTKPRLEACLRTNALKVTSFFDSLQTRVLLLETNEVLWNANHPTDLPNHGKPIRQDHVD